MKRLPEVLGLLEMSFILQPAYRTNAITIRNVIMNDAMAQFTQAPLSSSFLSRLLIWDSTISSLSLFLSVIGWSPSTVQVVTVLNLRYPKFKPFFPISNNLTESTLS
jgi:hypothetical protein